MASPTANAAAKKGSGIYLEQVTPITAETIWPPITGQGCDKSPCGTAKSKTADAPIEATSNAAPVGPTKCALINKIRNMLTNPPPADASRSVWMLGEAAADRGASLASLEAPDFTLPDITGKLHSLSDFRGKKVFLATWASW